MHLGLDSIEFTELVLHLDGVYDTLYSSYSIHCFNDKLIMTGFISKEKDIAA